MALEIPRLNRFNTQAPTSVGRTDMQAPSTAGAEAGFKTLDNAVNTFDKLNKEREKKQLDALDYKGTELANQYETRYATRLKEISLMEGDTTQAYADLDNEAVKWESELRSNYKNADPRLESILQKKIGGVNGRLNQTRQIQQAGQTYKYQMGVVDEAVKLRQDDMVNAVQLVNINDPASFAGLKGRVDEIVAFRNASGFKNGTVAQDENGKLIYNGDFTPNQIAKDVSGGIENVVKILNASGKGLEAKKIVEDYDKAGYLTADLKTKLLSGSNEVIVRNEALDALAKVRAKGLTGQAAINEIRRMGLSEPVAFKAVELNDTERRFEENARKTKDDMIHRRMYQEATEGNFVSFDDYKDRSLFYRDNKDILDVNTIKSIQSVFDSPKESNNNTINELYTLQASGALRDLSPTEFLTLKSRLSKQDATRWQTTYDNAVKPPSEDSVNTNMTRALKYFNELVDDKANRRPLFRKNRKGQYATDEEAQIIAEIQNEIRDEIVNYNKQMTTEEVNKIAQEKYRKAVAYKQNAAYVPESWQRVPPSTTTTTLPPAQGPQGPQGQQTSQLPREEQIRLYEKFKGKRLPRDSSRESELSKFMNDYNSGVYR